MVVIPFRIIIIVDNNKNSSPTAIARTLSSPPKEIDEDEDDEIEFEDSVINFGSNYNEALKSINKNIMELYNSADKCDIIKMGIINLEDERKNKKKAFKKISQLYKKDFKVLYCDTLTDKDINQMLEDLKGISNVESVKEYIDKYKTYQSLDLDLKSVIKSFIYTIAFQFGSCFTLNDSYFEEMFSETHISVVTHFTIFMNLFRTRDYSVKINRNQDYDDKNIRKSLIPDVKLSYKKRTIEILVVENAKFNSINGKRKKTTDTKKISILMHDQISRLYDYLDEHDKGEQVKELEVYGVITSKLYLFYKIMSFRLPSDVADFDQLKDAFKYMIKFRTIVDENHRRLKNIIEGRPVTPTNSIQWTIKIKKSPITLKKEEKELKNKATRIENSREKNPFT
ncbi:6365_t:CDS:10 [Entrophospora sp. SA101]|nr:6365_t:CDS:10 [Entrophospora sp. SA101]